MTDSRLEQLLADFFSDTLNEADRTELSLLLETDETAQRAFDAALHTEALLMAAHAPAATGTAEVTAPPASAVRDAVRARNPQRVTAATASGKFSRIRFAAIAAAAALVVGFCLWDLKRDHGAIVVESGRVQVNGTDRTELHEGDSFTVPAGAPARLVFPDGVSVEFRDATGTIGRSTAATRRTIQLDRGQGHFSMLDGSGSFTIQTPACAVESLGTVFDVGVSDADCAVTVERGRVRVTHSEKGYLVAAGELRHFAAKPSSIETVRGLRASVHGVVDKPFDGEGVTVRVTQVLGVLKGNAAAKPQVVLNQSLRVAAGDGDEGGLLHRCKNHEDFLRGLRPGDELSISITDAPANLFMLMYLPHAAGKHVDGQCGCKDALH